MPNVPSMDDADFDKALVSAAFALAGQKGWNQVNVAAAARAAGLPLARARERFPGRSAILLRFGRIADQTTLADPPVEGTVRDRLFYLIMQRLDVLQAHRAGVLALLRRLPSDPATAMLLDLATRRSMRWLLEASGVGTAGVRGEIRVRGLYLIWLWAVRTWQNDETADLSATMSGVDDALGRAERLASWIGGASASAAAPPVDDELPPEPPVPEPPVPESPPPPEPPEPFPPAPLPPASSPPMPPELPTA